MVYTVVQLNQMSQEAFVEALGAVFEDTPAIASLAWEKRPFTDVTEVHEKMVEVVKGMSQEAQITLIKAHPDLGTKAKMAEASVKEQSGVGLDRLTPEEYQRFQQLNESYKDKFGFPFIIAVKNHTKESILAAFDSRLGNSEEAERKRAIEEINQIAKFRLLDLIK